MNWGTRSINCYKKVRQVGQGTYGKVYEGIDRDSKRVVALKKIKTNKAKRKGGVPALTLREIRILRTYRHPNLVDMLEVVSSSKAGGRDCDNGSMYIVFEYFELDLSGLLDVKYKFTEAEIKCFIKQLLDALEYLHSESVCHRDIKCSNILISKDHVLKVTDFGLARVMNKKTTGDKKKYTNKVITLWYRPPELLLGETQYDMSVDMWSVGCIFLELMVGMPILQGKTEIEQLKRILELCGLPTQKDWARIKELPNYSMLKTLEKPPETSAEDSPSKTSSRRQQLALKPPPGRLPRYLSDNKIEKTASELAMRFLKLDPVLRVTASQALMSTYLLNAPTPQSLPPMILPRDSLHEWETKQRRKAEKRARANTASSLPQLDTDKKTDENANGGQTKPRRESGSRGRDKRKEHVRGSASPRRSADRYHDSPRRSTDRYRNLSRASRDRYRDSSRRRRDSPRRNDSPPRRRDSPPRWRDSPPRRRDSPPRRRDSPPRKRDSRRADSPPRRRDSPPRRRDSSPRRRDSPPRRRDSPQRRRDSPPRRRDSPPRRRDSPPRRRDSPPRRRDSPPRRRDSPPRRSDSPPRRKDTPPRHRKDGYRRRDGYRRNSRSPNRRDSKYGRRDSRSPRDGSYDRHKKRRY